MSAFKRRIASLTALLNRGRRVFARRVRLADQTYEDYWAECRGSYGVQFVDNICSTLAFSSVLDAGAGNGDVIRKFASCGKRAKGIELSSRAIELHAPDLKASGQIVKGSLTALPFDKDEFDLVFSSEVLEHLTETEVRQAVSELVRVAKRYLFLTISLRPSSNHNMYHPTLRPRAWWEQLFISEGCEVLQKYVSELQRVIPNATVMEIMKAGPTKSIIHELDWFINAAPYDLAGEVEPWFFVFEKKSYVALPNGVF